MGTRCGYVSSLSRTCTLLPTPTRKETTNDQTAEAEAVGVLARDSEGVPIRLCTKKAYPGYTSFHPRRRQRRGRRPMTKLPPPEQWVLCKMNEMEVAEMIERHIDFYVEDNNGNRRSVHL